MIRYTNKIQSGVKMTQYIWLAKQTNFYHIAYLNIPAYVKILYASAIGINSPDVTFKLSTSSLK